MAIHVGVRRSGNYSINAGAVGAGGSVGCVRFRSYGAAHLDAGQPLVPSNGEGPSDVDGARSDFDGVRADQNVKGRGLYFLCPSGGG